VIIADNVLFPLLASLTSLSLLPPLDTYRVHKAMSYHRLSDDAIFPNLRSRRQQIGVKGLYRGFLLANLISVINFNFYKQAMNVMAANDVKVDDNLKMIGFAVAAVAVVHPLDTIK
jgi:hypothetical protein